MRTRDFYVNCIFQSGKTRQGSALWYESEALTMAKAGALEHPDNCYEVHHCFSNRIIQVHAEGHRTVVREQS